MNEQGRDELGNYAYAGEALQRQESGVMDHLTMDYIYDSGRRGRSATPTAASRSASGTKRSGASCCSAC